MKNFVFAAAALLALGTAQAQVAYQPLPYKPLSMIVGAGFSAGGDELASAQYTNGDSVDIRAGGGVYLTAGVNYRFHPQFSMQATANFHIDDTSARNGSIRFRRYPIELLGYYHVNPEWRVGGGVRYVSGAKLSSSGVASGLNFEFDSTTSGVIEAEYLYGPKLGFKFRYVNETFKAARVNDVDANHFGASINYYF